MVRIDAMLARARSRLARQDVFALVATLLLIAKLLLTRYYVLGHAMGLGVIADACAIAAVVLACALTGQRLGRVLVLAASVVVPLLLLTGVVYASYFNELPTAGMLSVSPQLASVSEGTGRLLSWGYLLYAIDLPLLLVAALALPLRPASSRRRLLAASGVATLAAVTAAVAAIIAGPAVPAAVSCDRFGLFAYELSALQAPAPAAEARSEPGGIQARIDRLTGHDVSPTRRASAPAAGSMKGKNLIVIQMESLQTGLVGARVGTQSVVPNLERLAAESVYFPNAYSQIGRGNTSDAEFVTNTSLYPCLDRPSAVAYAGKVIPGLPRLLGDAGYQTMTMHTNEATFWNRDHLYPALGFEYIYDQGYFGNEEWAGFGASDKVLFDRGAMLLQAAVAEGVPFYAQFVTVSAHYPFTHTGGEGKLILPPEIATTETGRYLQAQSYADAQLGRFVKKLRKAGLLENTVLIVYGDHFGMRLDATDADRTLRTELLGHEYAPADFYNVPLLVRLPGGKGVREQAVVGQIDIMPTVADLLGLDISAVPHFGKSVFVDSPTLLTRASSVETYIDGKVAFFRGAAKGDGSYSSSTHLLIPGAKPPAHLENTRLMVELSQRYAESLPLRNDADAAVGYIPPSTKDIDKTPYK